MAGLLMEYAKGLFLNRFRLLFQSVRVGRAASDHYLILDCCVLEYPNGFPLTRSARKVWQIAKYLSPVPAIAAIGILGDDSRRLAMGAEQCPIRFR